MIKKIIKVIKKLFIKEPVVVPVKFKSNMQKIREARLAKKRKRKGYKG